MANGAGLDFQIKAQVDTKYLNSSIENGLKNQKFQITINYNDTALKQLVTNVTSIDKSVKQLNESFDKLSTTIQNISNSNNNLNNMSSGVKAFNTEVVTITDDLGRMYTETTRLDQATGEVISRQYEYAESLNVTTNNANSYNTAINSSGNITNSFNNITNNLTQNITNTGNAMRNTQSNAISLNRTLDRMGLSLTSIIRRFGQFYVASAPFRLFQTAVEGAKDAVLEFDSALTEYKKVSDLSGKSLQDYTEKLGKLGEAVAKTRTEMTEASTEFKKSGYSDEDSAKLAQIASMYQNIADEEISAGESASFIIAQLKAFYRDIDAGNETVEKSQHIIDAVNEVANNFAVSSGDLAENLGKVSSTMAVTGTTFEQTLGMLTAITEVTRNASTASRGLKMISQRLTQTLDENSSTGAKLRDIYAELGIEIKDEEGQIRSSYDILRDLSDEWVNLSKNKREYIALTSAGANQVQNFNALMENFGVAVKASRVAIESTGSAMKENEKYLDSIQGKVQKLKSAFQELVLGDGGLQNLAKRFLDLGTALLKFANTDIGKVIMVFSTLIITLAVVNASLVALRTALNNVNVRATISSLTTLITTLTSMVFGLDLSTASVNALNVSLQALNINPVIFAIEAFIAVIGLAVVAVNALVTTTDEHLKNIEKISQEYKSTKQSIELITEELKTVQDRIAEINSLGTIDVVTQEELDELEETNRKLERQLALKILANKEEKKRLETEAQKTLAKKQTVYTSYQQSAEDIAGGYTVASQKLDYVGALKAESREMIYQKQVANELKEALDDLTLSGSYNESEYYDLEARYEDATKAYDKAKEKAQEYSDVIKTATESLEEDSDTKQRATVAIDEYSDALVKTGEVTQEEIDSAKNAITAFNETGDGANDAERKIEELANALSELSFANTTIDGITEAFTNVRTAMDELNNTGQMNLETFNDLMSLDASYINILFDEEGALRTDIDAQRELYSAKVDEMAISQARQLVDTASKYYEENGTLKGLSAQLTQTTFDTWENVEATLADAEANGEDTTAIRNRINQIKAWADATKKSVSVSKSFSSAKKSGAGATKKETSELKKNTEALKENVDALKEIVDKYKKVISYIEGKFDDEIKKLQELKDAELKQIEDQINALEDEWDLRKEQLNGEIDLLQDARDAQKDYYNDRIKALKESNDALEDQLELEKLLEALATAKSKKVKVFREGQGFVYESDHEAVSKAQSDLDAYNRKKALEEQVKQLEDARDNEIKIYNDRIKALEDYIDQQERDNKTQVNNLEQLKNATEKNYDDQIKFYQDWKNKFKDMVNEYENEQNRLLALELTGIDFEADGWNTRLDNLSAFASSYKQYLIDLENAQIAYNEAMKQLKAEEARITSGGGGGSSTKTTDVSDAYKVISQQVSDVVKAQQEVQQKQAITQQSLNERHGDVGYQQAIEKKQASTSSTASAYKTATSGATALKSATTSTSGHTSTVSSGASALKVTVGKKATGADIISEDQMALIGDSPNNELVIGNKLNGSLMKLKQGTGIVNAKSTNTLAGILNTLGSFSASNFGQGNGVLNNSINNSRASNISIGNISLPNVSNGKEFVDYLQNFSLDMTQLAY